MIYRPRPYQVEAVDKALYELNNGAQGTLIISPTGSGKTIMFALLSEIVVTLGYRVLILIDRKELAEQAIDKIYKSTGIGCSLEKAEHCSLTGNAFHKRITIGSVQTLTTERMQKFDRDRFDYIVVDEAHKSAAATYRNIFSYFEPAKRIGVTATNSRGDGQKLISEGLYDTVAFQYLLPEAINDGYLVRIKAATIPIKIDYTGVNTSNKEISVTEIATALDPYLEEIVIEVTKLCKERKVVMFLPLIKTSQKVKALFEAQGVPAYEVSCETDNRKEILDEFDKAPKGCVMLNAMLLTVGWDCESVDCVIILRNTKVWALYMQMLGRGTRPLVDQKIFNSLATAEERKALIAASEKKDLLIIDFLYKIKKMNLCRPPSIFCEPGVEGDTVKFDSAVELLESNSVGAEVDLMELDNQSNDQAVIERENNLAKVLKQRENEKRKMLDSSDLLSDTFKDELVDFQPSSASKKAKVTENQSAILEGNGINPDKLDNAAEADKLISIIEKRKNENLSSPKQINRLKKFGFKDVKLWKYNEAQKVIKGIARERWRKAPSWIKDPSTYTP